MNRLQSFLKTPKTSAQLIAEYGSGTRSVALMRKLSDAGEVVLTAQVWTDHGYRSLFWMKPAEPSAYLRRRLGGLGVDPEKVEVL